jgi:chromosome partitioning protein
MIISVVNNKGGVGKSTMACHLAAWLVDQGNTVAVIDADGQTATTDHLSRARPTIPLLAATDPDEIRRTVAGVRAKVDVVVCDAPPGLEIRTRTLLELSDLLLVPAQASRFDMRATKQLVTFLASIDEDRTGKPLKAWVFLNLFKTGTKLSKSTHGLLELFGLSPASRYVSDRNAFRVALDQKCMVWDLKDGKPAADEINALFNEVIPDELKRRDARPDGRTDTTARRRGPAAEEAAADVAA